jgi:hypothetical protein
MQKADFHGHGLNLFRSDQPAQRPIAWHERVLGPPPPAEPSAAPKATPQNLSQLSKHEFYILRHIESAVDGITRAKLLHAVSWKFSARSLDHLLANLESQGCIRTTDGRIVAISPTTTELPPERARASFAKLCISGRRLNRRRKISAGRSPPPWTPTVATCFVLRPADGARQAGNGSGGLFGKSAHGINALQEQDGR